ncbi:alpha/beta fold hydrolase [Streptomyces mirabilis]|uniref:alpha/beta fold hydrolase n=1 Tax=Streptomyces mirabilis TaxID=68239 RepID=UPI003666C06E
MPQTTAIGTDGEFAQLPSAPVVQRRWVTVATGGHISGVFWGTAAPSIVLLHEAGGSARSWDDLLLVLDRPAIAVDLPGHGRSSWRDRGDYRPRRSAAPLEEAVRSFAPGRVPVVGRGLGALAAIAVAARFPEATGRLVLVDTLPGSLAAHPQPWPASSPVFATREEARGWLAKRAVPDPARTAELETVQAADGTWSWRHHLGSLPEPAPTVLDDESLWEQLAAVPAPLFVRTHGGPVGDDLADRFRTQVPGGETVTTEDRPEALAKILRTLIP